MEVLASGERRRLILGTPEEPGGYVLFPAYSGVSSDPTIVTVGDGGSYRLAAISVGTAPVDRVATVTITRASDGALFSFDVTVTAQETGDAFTVFLGETF